jgi:hypothetical protein
MRLRWPTCRQEERCAGVNTKGMPGKRALFRRSIVYIAKQQLRARSALVNWLRTIAVSLLQMSAK